MDTLKHCTVHLTEFGCVTTFADGTNIGSYPHPDDPSYQLIAARLGYGVDLMRFCQEHDAMHSICAEWFFDKPSPVLWNLAHGQEIEKGVAVQEEAFVQVCQRWIRADERPIIGDADWDGLKSKAQAVLDGLQQVQVTPH